MSYELIVAIIVCVGVLLGGVLAPWLKKKGLWVVALFGVNIIEQVCKFLELQGYGAKKYTFVRTVLLMLAPKLTDQQIENIIETLVKKMNELKEV